MAGHGAETEPQLLHRSLPTDLVSGIHLKQKENAGLRGCDLERVMPTGEGGHSQRQDGGRPLPGLSLRPAPGAAQS